MKNIPKKHVETPVIPKAKAYGKGTKIVCTK